MDKISKIDHITTEWLTKILKENQKIINSCVTSFYPDLEESGWFANIMRLNLTYDKPEPSSPASLILKIPNFNEIVHAIGYQTHYYYSEHFFYKHLAHLKSIKVPECYYNNLTDTTFMILMEDFGHNAGGDQFEGASIEEAKQIINQLAKFHAHWWNHSDLDKYEWLLAMDAPLRVDFWSTMYESNINGFFEKFGYLLTNEEKALTTQWVSLLHTTFRILAEKPRTIVHGDARFANILKIQNPSEETFAWVDWHAMYLGKGVLDLSYFLSQSIKSSLRKEHEKTLVSEYYSQLVDLGIHDYSWEQCWDDYRLGILYYMWIPVVAGATAHEKHLIEISKKMTERAYAAIRELEVNQLIYKLKAA